MCTITAISREEAVHFDFCVSAAAGMISSLYSISRSFIVVIVLYAFCFNAVKVRRGVILVAKQGSCYCGSSLSFSVFFCLQTCIDNAQICNIFPPCKKRGKVCETWCIVHICFNKEALPHNLCLWNINVEGRPLCKWSISCEN